MIVKALLDSNVIVAALAAAHEHHRSSLAVLSGGRVRLAVTAHSYAEVYATLSRRGKHAPFRFTAEEAWAAIESVAAVTDLIGLTPAQTFSAIREFARDGGIGARLYDRLMGEAAVVHGFSAIVTWNVSHMRSLFPKVEILSPTEFSRSYGR